MYLIQQPPLWVPIEHVIVVDITKDLYFHFYSVLLLINTKQGDLKRDHCSLQILDGLPMKFDTRWCV